MEIQKPLGILMLNTKFPRIPGDVGNLETFSFPIRKLVVEGAAPGQVVGGKPILPEPFLEGARTLEREGVAAITTSCGFLAMFQRELAAAVRIPVFSSSLLQLNLVNSMLPEGKQAGILTVDARNLGERHFRGVGVRGVPEVIYGMEGTHFYDVFVGNQEDLDRSRAEREMVDAAIRMTAEHPEVGAIVFECTNMPPYARAVSSAVHLPVYDITTLANTVMGSLQISRV